MTESPGGELRTNPTAVFAVALGIVLSPMALPLGWFAREQIKRSGERGRQLCTVAMSLGAIALMLWLVGGVIFVLWYASL